MNQKVYVTTAEGSSVFLVHERVPDAFIAETVEAKYGRQESGEAHEWAAYDEEETDAASG